MKYITKKVPLTKEQRKMYIKEKYVEYPIKDEEGKDRIAEAYSSRILKRSNDEQNKNINNVKLMYGNGLCLTIIGPDDVFQDEKFEYCISKEEVPFYHVDVFLANEGFTVTDLWTDNLLEAIDYYDKLEKFFQLNPLPATDLGK